MVVRAHGADAVVHADLVANRSVHDRDGGLRRRRARPARHAARGHREDHGQVLGSSARHDGVHGDFFDRELPQLAIHRRP